MVRSKRRQIVHMRCPTSGTLSRSRAAQARLTRPIRDPSACVRGHESHRPALELLRATVRGTLIVRGAVHPPTTLVCWQVRRPPTARVVAILRHHHPGARHGPPARPVDEQGAAHTACPPRTTTTQPTHRLCSLWMAGDHWTLRWKLFLMAAKQQHLAAAWRRAGARAARRAHASVCAEAREGPHRRSGRRLVVEPADHRCLAGPPGPTAELGGLWSPWISSRVRV